MKRVSPRGGEAPARNTKKSNTLGSGEGGRAAVLSERQAKEIYETLPRGTGPTSSRGKPAFHGPPEKSLDLPEVAYDVQGDPVAISAVNLATLSAGVERKAGGGLRRERAPFYGPRARWEG